jgi:hypothetical protein
MHSGSLGLFTQGMMSRQPIDLGKIRFCAIHLKAMKSSNHLRDILNAASGFPVSLQGIEKDLIEMHETLPIEQQKSSEEESIDAPGDLLNVPFLEK